MDRPRIGIPCNDVKHVDGAPEWVTNLATRSTYVDAILAAGGLPVVIPQSWDLTTVAAYVHLCDGFVFPGGPDLDPIRYGQERHSTATSLHHRREEFELELIEQVLEADKPWFAICMGCQAVNVVLGGTLYQDIEDLIPGAENHRSNRDGGGDEPPRHDVLIEADSLLHSLVKTSTLRVNTSHHQAVERPGKGLRIVARSKGDGIVEALELDGAKFGLAVQWHPEWLTKEPQHLQLFEALVAAANASRD